VHLVGYFIFKYLNKNTVIILLTYCRFDFFHRTSLDLENLTKEKSHYLELSLMDQPGILCLHVSITALINQDSTSDIKTHEDDTGRIKEIENDFSLFKTTTSMEKVGWLQVNCNMYFLVIYIFNRFQIKRKGVLESM